MRRLFFGVVAATALALGALPSGCGDECDRQCDKLLGCLRDMGGGKLDMSPEKLKRQCKARCRKSRKKLTASVEDVCGQ